MKILAPISDPEEVEMLVANGADELYCGLVPPEWIATFSGVLWLNRRSPAGANLGSHEALADLVRAAHGHGVPVFLTLNAPAYNDRQIGHLRDLARRAVGEAGVDAFIVSDVALMLALLDLGLDTKVHVSSVAGTLNTEALRFYEDLGVSRIILPRALSLREIEELVVSARVDLEVFVLNDGCAFEEGLCHTVHHHRVGAFCTNITRWDHIVERADGRPAGADERDAIAAHLRTYREWIWYLNACGCSVSPKGLPYGPCGLCAIPALRRCGVAALKIVGREASAFRKLMSVRLVKEIVAMVEDGATPGAVVRRARAIRATPELCDSGYMCYYRDLPDSGP